MPHSFKPQVQIVKLNKLKPHEEIDPTHLKELKEEIWMDKMLKFALVVDKNTNIILDGQHRFNAIKELGCSHIPVVYVDYNSPIFEVQSWKGNPHLTKKDVIEAGLSGRKFPPKTSKHMVKIDGSLQHIFTIEKRVNIPLEKLR